MTKTSLDSQEYKISGHSISLSSASWIPLLGIGASFYFLLEIRESFSVHKRINNWADQVDISDGRFTLSHSETSNTI